MIKYLLAFICLWSITSAAYNNKIALELAYMSGVAYNSVDSINSWTCPECAPYKCTDVLY